LTMANIAIRLAIPIADNMRHILLPEIDLEASLK
jgi:hypothetical protein